MDRAAAIDILRSHEGKLRKRGVRHAALFGSVARGDATATSDVDVVIVLDRETVRDVYDYVGVVHFIEDMFPVTVDVANRETFKERVRRNAERDAIDAF
jgi:predicted nucleotidyltransferase